MRVLQRKRKRNTKMRGKVATSSASNEIYFGFEARQRLTEKSK